VACRSTSITAPIASSTGRSNTLSYGKVRQREESSWLRCVPVGAAGRRVGDPCPGRGLNQLAQHGYQRNSGVSVLYD
jgi:hypothetical protein